jgi:hypothetical protein
MFNPTRDQARDLFFGTWQKYRAGEPLEGLEQTALDVILMHPEYQHILDQRERYLERDYLPESGELNPFLHMSLHLSIAEQLAIGQPHGIRELFQQIESRLGSRHDAIHAALECLAETVWQANRNQAPPDQQAYLECLRRQGRGAG